jgi:hypothetical protein
MSAVTSIPVSVEPEAAELVAELGLQTVFERILEHARQTIPGLHRLHVRYALPYDTGLEPGVFIEAYRDPTFRQTADPNWKEFSGWVISTFSPDEYRHFPLWIFDEDNHAG